MGTDPLLHLIRDLRLEEAVAELRAKHVPSPVSDRWGKWWEGEANNPGRD